MSSPADTPLDALLLRELEALRQGLSAPPPEDAPAKDAPTLAVARLVHGLAREQWEKLRDAMPGQAGGWCAVELCPRHARLCVPLLADCEQCEDPLTGALLAAPLLRQLRREAARAKRGQSQVALAVFALEDDELGGLDMLAAHVRRFMLDCDSLGLLDTRRLVLLLPGAGLFKAQALLEEMLGNDLPRCTVGIASGCPDDDGSTLLQQAMQAMRQAREQGCPLRVFRQVCDPLSERKTLVRSDEKRFLFSGGDI